MDSRPVASLSLDLDNQWSYMKTHGDPGWERLPSYLDIVVPRVLDFLEQRGLTITFFVVGQDAVLPENRAALRALADAGHEIGNHSFHHEPWLHLYSDRQIADELARAEDSIASTTGQCPVGFRGPGFSVSEAVLKVLARRGYRYDASTFPTFLGPLARAYYFMTARLTAAQRRERAVLFGKLGEGFRSIRPYRWRLGEQSLLEIPVTTMPLFKVPIHISYLLYLASFSRLAALGYWRSALTLCRLTGTQPSLLLHPLDFLGYDDTQALAFFPAMRVPSGPKLELVSDVLALMASQFRIVTMRQHAEEAARTASLPGRAPSFEPPPRRLAFA